MKKFICLILSAIMVLSITSCSLLDDGEPPVVNIDPDAVPPGSVEELYSYYDQVQRNMTKKTIDKLLGKGEESRTENGLMVKYRNESKSAGVDVVYTDGGVVSSKILYYNKQADVAKFCTPFKKEQINELDTNMLVKNIKEVLGDGIEVACQYNMNSSGGFSKIYIWFNEDGSSLQVHADDDIAKQFVYNEKEQ